MRLTRAFVSVTATLVIVLVAAGAVVWWFDDDGGDGDGDDVVSVSADAPVTDAKAAEPLVAEPPVTEPPVTERPLPSRTVQSLPGRTIVSGSGCPFGISGEAIDLKPAPAGGRFDTEGGQGVAYVLLGRLAAEVRVPGYVLREEEKWRFEPVDLGGRSAIVWLDGPNSASRSGNRPFVQVRYFPGGDEPCSSFMVTVDGGTVQANRAAAVDLAKRVLLPSDLGDLDLPGAEGGPVAGLELPGTTWGITGSWGQPSLPLVTFTNTMVRWTDGCATVAANYALDRAKGELVLSNLRSTDPGCTPPTHPEFTLHWSRVASVMSAERLGIGLVDGMLHVGDLANRDYLVLGPPR